MEVGEGVLQMRCKIQGPRALVLGLRWMNGIGVTPRVQVPNNRILSKILTYITTILKPST